MLRYFIEFNVPISFAVITKLINFCAPCTTDNRVTCLLIILLLFALSILGGNVYAQDQKLILIKGVIIDEESETLPAVSIYEKGPSNGTVIDINGEYSLEASADEKTSIPSADASIEY